MRETALSMDRSRCEAGRLASVRPQVSIWHEELARVVPLRHAANTDSTDLKGCLHRQQLGATAICRVDCASAVLRSFNPGNLEENLLIVRQETGTMRLVSSQEHHILEPGDLAVVDCRFPVELRADRQVCFTILAVRLNRGVAEFTGLTNSGSIWIDSSKGGGAVASTFLEKFCAEGSNLPEDIVDSLVRSLVSVLDTAAFEASGALACSRQRLFSVQQIKRHISEHLRDPDLNPSAVARDLGVSRRHLDELFKDESTTISRYIWSRRLQGCQRDLEDPRYAGLRIIEIAFSWGFNSASHFSRTFNDRFKMSPSQARALAASGRAERHELDAVVAAG